ncbi:N6-Methyl-AMP deaminase isoform X2 [Parasteatoda tepidariorum]|uniref:N6-Methyl-AMP deaminase isoform X2 n=1 Tax=Parasteatoda tepidariorum TaxID=114398 RepID=UPI00077FB4E0
MEFKIELHAHLNGSLSHRTLEKLISIKKQKEDGNKLDLKLPKLSSNNLSQCFETFNLIHKITDSPEAIYVATCDVIEEFYNDGVLYLELRTTPKDVLPSMTQDIYVETVLKAIQDACSTTNEEIKVKLLLSVDRKRPFVNAEKTLQIAEKFNISSGTVVGIDFSGDPTTEDIHSFLPILESAKKKGLKLAIHISEVPNKFEEVEKLLNLQPDRLGHGTYLLPEQGGSVKNFELFQKLQIPLEICLTSNVVSKTVPSYADHHFKYLKEMGYPCILCTDDKGVFNTTLSHEYYLAFEHYSLTQKELFDLSFSSIDHIFSPNTVKEDLKDRWSEKRKALVM